MIVSSFSTATSTRKCSAVVCRDAPAWFAAEFLSSVFVSVLLVMVILPFFVLRSFSDSIRLISGRTAAPPRSSRRPFLFSHGPTVSNHGGVPAHVCIHRSPYRGRTSASAQVDCCL